MVVFYINEGGIKMENELLISPPLMIVNGYENFLIINIINLKYPITALENMTLPIQKKLYTIFYLKSYID